MTRVVSLFLPTWSTDRVRRKAGDTAPAAEAPLVLIGHDGRRRDVVAAVVAAQAAGLRVRVPATKAQVRVPVLLVHAPPPADHAEELYRLAPSFRQRYAPTVLAGVHDGIVIDKTGPANLPGWKAH